jgi:hypothetical protein
MKAESACGMWVVEAVSLDGASKAVGRSGMDAKLVGTSCLWEQPNANAGVVVVFDTVRRTRWLSVFEIDMVLGFVVVEWSEGEVECAFWWGEWFVWDSFEEGDIFFFDLFASERLVHGDGGVDVFGKEQDT